jgi:hypothetical protein
MLSLMSGLPASLLALDQGGTSPRLRRFALGIAGYYVIEPDGSVKAWTTGDNIKGTSLALGHEQIVRPYVAQAVPALQGATAIARGNAEYAVMGDGRVLAWGTNANGLLGNTPLAELEVTAQPHRPVPIPTATMPMPKIVDVAAGGDHVMALTADGAVFTWGNGQVGQLGIGDLPIINFKTHTPASMAYVPFPVQVPGISGVRGIAAGSMFSLALLNDGSVKSWGDNQYGQLGDGTLQNRAHPVTVSGITNAVAVAAGGLDYSAALLADGTVMTWGWGNGAFGRPEITSRSANPNPMPVPGVSGAIAIAAGGQHMLALTGTGRVIAWGFENVYHPVGHPGIPDLKPAAVPLITTARAVFAGPLSSQALLADGTFMVWGALPSLWFGVDGSRGAASRFPVPMVVKGLQ